ncbi:MAG: adenine methylase [Solirubrobacterales bacterium]|jgi:DNA adenine methylase|nr:adenine methylase [Solirubrobacterales bacterium]
MSISLPSADADQRHDIRKPPAYQILKWIGNKQRFAALIARNLPAEYGRYIEPFVGTGAVLAAMQPEKAVAGDTLKPLIDLWKLVQNDPDELAAHYKICWEALLSHGKAAFAEILSRYNAEPNPGDLLALSRSCYGGVVRFTKNGTMSTPMGPHRPIDQMRLREHLYAWQERVSETKFRCQDYSVSLADAAAGDVVYCDPPYAYSQAILYGAHSFDLDALWASIQTTVDRGALVAVSINGHRRNGKLKLSTPIPDGIFQREMLIERGGCMLRRFQLAGKTVAGEHVTDRLLFSW